MREPRPRCSVCPSRRRLPANMKRRRLREPALWPLIVELGHEREMVFRKDDFICERCFGKVIHGHGSDIEMAQIDQLPVPELPQLDSSPFDLVSSLPMSLYDSQPRNLSNDFDQVSSMDIVNYNSAPFWHNSPFPTFSQATTVESSLAPTPDSSQGTATESSQATTTLSSSFATSTNFIDLPIKSCRRTERCCFLCGSIHGRRKMTRAGMLDIWLTMQVYVPPSNRCCSTHLNENSLLTEDAKLLIEASCTVTRMSAREVTSLITELTTMCHTKTNKLNFETTSEMTSDQYKLLTSLDKDNFHHLLSHCGRIKKSCNRTPASALGIYMMKFRLNVSQEFLGFLFDISQPCVSDILGTVGKVLEEDFVPFHLGYDEKHVTRQEFIEKHNCKYVQKILGSDPTSATAVIDATYLFIQKPSDHEVQRRTFSGHKRDSLLKPVIISGANGYVLEVEGLYYTDGRNNDASILNSMARNAEGFTSFFIERDDLVVDRGFRDSMKMAKEKKFNMHMPRMLERGRKQFDTLDANESRRVSMVRWVIESVNGRIKNMYPFFGQRIHNSYIPRLRTFLRVAVAIINCYCPPLFTEKPEHAQLAEEAVRRMTTPNKLYQYLVDNDMLNKRAIWKKRGDEDVNTFPEMTSRDMKIITIGEYQTKKAAYYASQMISSSKGFVYYHHRDPEEHMVMTKIPSRFKSKLIHHAHVRYDPELTGAQSIDEWWYCSCRTGLRSAGCCSHVATLIWYLGYYKYNPDAKIPTCKYKQFILDAAALHPVFEESDSENEMAIDSD